MVVDPRDSKLRKREFYLKYKEDIEAMKKRPSEFIEFVQTLKKDPGAELIKAKEDIARFQQQMNKDDKKIFQLQKQLEQYQQENDFNAFTGQASSGFKQP